MAAYRTRLTIVDPNRLVLSGLPFQPGEKVEVVVTADNRAVESGIANLRALFQATQALPRTRAVSEAEIIAEVAAIRGSR